jgi:predicted O-methyltransferase YrrM
MTPIRLTVDDSVSAIDLSPFARYMSWHPEYLGYFLAKPGSEHHSLLSFLTRQLPKDSTVVDLGTLYGASALALAHGNPSGRVITYDIRDNIPPAAATIRNVGNIEFRIRDGILDSDTYLDAKLILLDVDPHDGIQERHFIQRMMRSQYNGVVVCDDIYCNAAMKSFWDWIPLEKYDVTRYGHCSGTGIVVFDRNIATVDVRA